MAEEPEDSYWISLWREGLRAMSLGWDLALPIFAGVFAGHFLDRLLNTGYVFTLGLLFLGIFTSYYNLARFIRRQDRNDRPREKEKNNGVGEENQ